jgi:hypothetical protein
MLAEKLKQAGFDPERMKLVAAWQTAARGAVNASKRQMAFWSLVRKDLNLQNAACALLDELLLKKYGHVRVDGQYHHADLEQQPVAGNPQGGASMLKVKSALSLKPATPSLQQRLATLSVAASIFDSYRLEDGTPIGSVKMAHIPAIKAKYKRHHALLDIIQKHAQPDDPQATVCECVKPSDIERMIQKAAEAQDEAA